MGTGWSSVTLTKGALIAISVRCGGVGNAVVMATLGMLTINGLSADCDGSCDPSVKCKTWPSCDVAVDFLIIIVCNCFPDSFSNACILIEITYITLLYDWSDDK